MRHWAASFGVLFLKPSLQKSRRGSPSHPPPNPHSPAAVLPHPASCCVAFAAKVQKRKTPMPSPDPHSTVALLPHMLPHSPVAELPHAAGCCGGRGRSQDPACQHLHCCHVHRLQNRCLRAAAAPLHARAKTMRPESWLRQISRSKAQAVSVHTVLLPLRRQRDRIILKEDGSLQSMWKL
eukprot:1160303-Pelagomonas_calceolata.AAC.3